MPIVYLDVCCLNRPLDDQRQDRIRLESEAILLVLGHVERGEWTWIGSEAVDLEIAQNTDIERLERLQLLTATASGHVTVSPAVTGRAMALEALGFHAYDALHVACAEASGAAAGGTSCREGRQPGDVAGREVRGMTTETMTLWEIRQAGLAALAKALGPVGMIRFLQQDEHGAGDYTANRYDLLGDTDVASLVARIEAGRRSGKDSPAQG